MYPMIEKKLNQYFDEHYNSIKNQVKKSDLKFSFKEKNYYFTYQHKKNSDLTFKIVYSKEKKITSTYQQDFVDGKSFLNKYLKKISSSVQSVLKDENIEDLSLKTTTTLNDLSEKERNKILTNKAKEVPFYEVEYTTSILNLSTQQMKEKLEDIHNLLKKNKINPSSYQVKFTLEGNGMKGFILRNVSANLIEYGKVENIINTLYQTGQKIDQSTKMEMEELK